MSMPEDVETPELVELQDTLSKTNTEIVNELPSESEPEAQATETKAAESKGLTEAQKKNLPEALQKAILAKQSGSDDKEAETESGSEMNISEAIPDDGVSPEDPTAEQPWQSEPEPAEPEPTPEPEPEAFEAPQEQISEERYREIYSAHSMSQRVASMPLADYEAWLFPDNHSPDYLRGQMCLSRVESSLKAANGGRAVAEPWQIKIGAALWSRLHYNHGDVETTRRELERAPPMEIMPLIPRNASEAISVIEEMQTTREQPSSQNWGIIGACGAAVLIPLILLRRK